MVDCGFRIPCNELGRRMPPSTIYSPRSAIRAYFQPASEKIHQLNAEITADAGIVRTHAHTTRPATPHRTARGPRVEPTPTIAPVIVWVVLTGIPSHVAP